MERKIILIAAVCCLFACKNASTVESHECSVDTVESGLNAEQLAEINAIVGTSKASLEEGTFDALLPAFRSPELNKIPAQATSSSADTLLVDGCQVLRLTPATVGSSDTVILYLHGGAYFFPMSTVHIQMVDELVGRLGVVAYMPSYPLAGYAHYDESHGMVRALYAQLIREGKTVLLMGDSAGGGFALALAQWAHENGLDMPARMVLLSPWLDVTMSNPAIADYEKKDVSLCNYALRKCGRMWADAEDDAEIRNNTQVCPLYGDLTGMPSTLLFVGTAEVMYPDVCLLYEKMKAQGAHVRLVCATDLFHVYPVYFKMLDIPAASAAVAEMCSFLH